MTCCSVLQCVAVCCSVLQCIHQWSPSCLIFISDLRYDMLQCVAVCCSVLQCVAVCCSVLQCVAVYPSVISVMSDIHQWSKIWLIYLWLVALLRKMTCNIRHPMGLRHPASYITVTSHHMNMFITREMGFAALYLRSQMNITDEYIYHIYQ